MIFIALFLLLVWKFFKDKNLNNISKIVYSLGLIIILINVFWVHYLSGSYFEGSDATAYYQSAKEIKNNFELLNLVDIRYIGYNIYQIVASYPFFNIELYASILIKLTSWSFFFLSIISLNKSLFSIFRINLAKKKFTYLSIIIFGLWLSFYNFRDIVILICLIFISSFYLNHTKYRLLKILSFLFVLFYFRFFYVALLIFSFILALSIEAVWRKNFMKLGKVNLLFISILLISTYIMAISSIQTINIILSQNENILNSRMQFNISASSPLVSFLKGLFAGNSIAFLFNYFFGNIARAFIITPISAILLSLIFFYNYIYILQMFGIILKSKYLRVMCQSNNDSPDNNNNNNNNNSKRLMIFSTTIIVFIFLTVIVYSINMEGVQERIRATLLPLLSIVILIASEYIGYRLKFIKIFAFGLILFVSIISLLN